VRRPPMKWSAIAETLSNGLQGEVLTFNTVAMRSEETPHFIRSCRRHWTIGAATPGVGLLESCRVSSCGPSLFSSVTYVGVGTITVAKASLWFPAS
jgi:hypothetical protein